MRKYLVMDEDVYFAKLSLQGNIETDFEQMLFEMRSQSDETKPFLWVRIEKEKKEPKEVQENVRLLGAETYSKEGNVLSSFGIILPEPENSIQENAQTTFTQEALRPVGDLCADMQDEPGYDGKINVWDLLFLLNRYGLTTSDALYADIGRMGSSVAIPLKGPFSHNMATQGPDGVVDVWDLIVMLNAYGATIELINTPFTPAIQSIQKNGTLFTITWNMPFPNDYYEYFMVYSRDNQTPFDLNPLVNPPAAKISRNVLTATIQTNKPYIAIAAYNPDNQNPSKYFSPLVFIADPFVNQVAYWSLDNTLIDNSGNGHPGSLAQGSITYVPGVNNSAIEFNSKPQIIVADHAQLDTNDEMTLMFWYKKKVGGSNTPYQIPLMKWYDAPTGQWYIFISTANNIRTEGIAFSSGEDTFLCGEKNTYPINPNNEEWVHLVFIFDKGIARKYRNGVLEDQVTARFKSLQTSEYQNDHINIGYMPWQGAPYDFYGFLDEIRLLNKALNAQQIFAIYNQEKP